MIMFPAFSRRVFLERSLLCANVSNNSFKAFGIFGEIGAAIGKNIKGEKILQHTGLTGKCKLVVGINIEGEEAVSKVGTPGEQSLESGILNTLLYENVTGKDSLKEIHAGLCLAKHEEPEEYEKLIKKYKINEMLDLTDSITGKSPEEVKTIAKRIYLIYDSIKDKLEEIQ